MKSPVELILDTTDNNIITVGLKVGAQTDLRRVDRPPQRAQIVLPLIETLLKKHGKSFSDISAITVNPGPGSFTGIRVGLSVANALGTLYGISINGKNPGEPLVPTYE